MTIFLPLHWCVFIFMYIILYVCDFFPDLFQIWCHTAVAGNDIMTHTDEVTTISVTILVPTWKRGLCSDSSPCRKIASNIVLIHDGFHTRTSEQDERKKCESDTEIGVCQKETADGWCFFLGGMGRSKRETFLGGNKSIHASEVAVRPCISFNPFSTPPSISFHRTYQRHS